MERPQHAPIIAPVRRPVYPAVTWIAPDIVWVPEPDPDMSIRIWFPRGPLDSPSLNPMAAMLADRLVHYGAGGLSSEDFDREKDRTLCKLRVNTTTHASEIHLTCPQKAVQRGLELASYMITAPAFPSNEFERIREQETQDSRDQERDVWYVSTRWLAGRLWEENSTRARWAVGRAEDYQSASLSEVHQSWQARFQSTHPTLICSGPMAASELQRVIRTTFPVATRHAPIQCSFPCTPRPGTVTLASPYSDQTLVRLSFVLPITEANELAAEVAEFALSGFYGRIERTLRLERGWTYGCDVGISILGDHMLFWVGCSVRPDVADEVLLFLQQTIQGLTNGVTESELAAKKQTAASVSWHSTYVASKHTGVLSGLLDRGIAPEHRSDRIQARQDLTLDQVNHTLRQWNVEDLITSIVQPK